MEKRVYFDTEFTGLTKNTTLISIGMVTDDGKSFYAEFLDYDKSQVNEWIEENVIKNLTYPSLVNEGDEWYVTGFKQNVRMYLLQWLDSIRLHEDKICFISDVSHYDFVLLVDLLTNGASAMELPDYIVPACYDINQDIMKKYCNGKLEEAFNISRETIISDNGINVEGEKHNSLYDAKVICEIYKLL